MGTATLSTRLAAICLGAALAFAQLLCAVHKAEALAHKSGEVCGLCLSLAKVDHALVEVGPPPPVHSLSALNHQPDARVVPRHPGAGITCPLPSAIKADSGRLVN